MRYPRLLSVLIGILALGSVTTWSIAAEYSGRAPAGHYEPKRLPSWTLHGPDAERRRLEMLKRAAVRLEPGEAAQHALSSVPPDDPLTHALPVCRFVSAPPSGTSAKFDCVFDGGELVKVKYGRNPEIHAEVAASRLLHLLDYPADTVVIVPRLRCYGCPRFPFVTMTLLSWTFAGNLLAPHGHANGYTDFEWVAVERKLPAHAIETEGQEGWAWWELKYSAAPGADLDALRLLAVFLAHWDNKHSNQRLVCLDGPPPSDDAMCARPLALIQDLGATFGPTKVNLARWRDLPVWADRSTCLVSMRTLPYSGGTFVDATISEAGRAQLAGRFDRISKEEIRQLFSDARFPQFHTGTDDARDLQSWAAAFRGRVDQIVRARC